MVGQRLSWIAAASRREQSLLAREAGYPDGVRLPDKLAAIEVAAAAFGELGVSYALIGGVAVGIRSGVPRATLDVDFAIPSTADAEVLIEHLRARGFELRGRFPHSINFVHASGEPVQLAFDPQFDPMIVRAETMTFDRLELRVVTTDDLIAMKRRAASDPGRRRSKALRDQADIALLEGDIPAPDEGW